MFPGARWRPFGSKKRPKPKCLRGLPSDPFILDIEKTSGPFPRYRFEFVEGDPSGAKLRDLTQELVYITGISEDVLRSPTEFLAGISIATKSSWMTARSTTRVEDEAYCLMGIFGLSMPLL